MILSRLRGYELKAISMKEEGMHKYALNTSTISMFHLSADQQIDIAIDAGYDAIELWMGDIYKYVETGNSLSELAKKMSDGNLEYSNTIAFQRWCSSDRIVRRQALENIKHEMDIIKILGGKAYAAPPYKIESGTSLEDIAYFFSELVRLGRSMGIEPYLEFWGHSPILNSLEDAHEVLKKSSEKAVKVLADTYHIYKGGGDLEYLRSLKGTQIGVFHINDYPQMSRDEITDEDRVFPGEGIVKWQIYREIIGSIQYEGVFSLELFLKDNRGKSAFQLAEMGLKSSKRAMEQFI